MIGEGYARVALAFGSIVVASLLAGTGYYVGDARARAEITGEYEQRTKDAALAYLEAARRETAAAAERVTQVRRGQAAALSRVKELEHALSQLAHDPARNFTDDELQAFGSLRAAYAAGRRELPDGVRGRASGSESAQGLRAESVGLGLSLRQPAR